MISRPGEFNASLDTYAEHTAAINCARMPAKTVTGYSDFRYHMGLWFGWKTEKDILAIVKGMKELKGRGYPLEYVINDQGWCDHDSEWLKPGERFPSGQKALSRAVRRHGFRFGLWFAPYFANVNTEVAKEHPEWMVMDCETGKPLYMPVSNIGPCYLLDYTVPGAVDWLQRIVRTMVREWNVEYILRARASRFRDVVRGRRVQLGGCLSGFRRAAQSIRR